MKGPRRIDVVALVLVVALSLVTAGCRFGTRRPEPVPPNPSGPSGVYVAVGASETVGIGADHRLVQGWPQVLFRESLPRRTTFFNLGIPGSTVADALVQQLPEAIRLAPTLATVWLNVNDLLAGVPVATFETDLGRLLRELRRGGQTRVLVADTPPLERLPAYLACRPEAPVGSICPLPDRTVVPGPEEVVTAVDLYNAAIARAAAAAGAEIVDLNAVVRAARSDGSDAGMVSDDGFHPSTAGHKAVAAAFAAALETGP